MNSRGFRPATAALAVIVICALAGPVASASADSAVISAVDAGGGQMHVTVEVTSTSCTIYGYCGWFSFAVERHSSLPCVEDEAFLMGVHPGLETAGTVREEWNYEPFFPRLDKICVFVDNGAGTHAVGEAMIALPSGYGRQYSTAHNCSYFANQRRAEYYLELYPGDPSGLDADHDGSACEDNRCPCGAEAIPPEPAPAPNPTTVAPATPAPECVLARERKAYWGRQVSKDRANVRYTSGARERRYWTRKRTLAEGRLKADKAWVSAACG